MGRSVNTIVNSDRKKYIFKCDAYIIRVDNIGYLMAPWLRTWNVFSELVHRNSFKMRNLNTYNVLVTWMIVGGNPKIVFMCKTLRNGEYNREQLRKICQMVSNQTLFYSRLAGMQSEVMNIVTKGNRKYYIREIYADCDPDDTKTFRAFSRWRGRVYLDLDTPISLGL